MTEVIQVCYADFCYRMITLNVDLIPAVDVSLSLSLSLSLSYLPRHVA